MAKRTIRELHDAIEAALPDTSLEDEEGVMHTACSLAMQVERELIAQGFVEVEED